MGGQELAVFELGILAVVDREPVLREGVVDDGRDALLVQRGLHGVAAGFGDADRVLVEDVPRGDRRGDDAFDAGQQFVVAGGGGAAGRVAVGQAAQLDAQDGGLDAVEARVVAKQFVVVALSAAVGAELAAGFGDLVVVGGDEPGVAIGAKVFGGIEAEGSSVADGSRGLAYVGRRGAAGQLAAGAAFIAGAKALGAVFDDLEPVLFGDGHDAVHFAGAAEDVDGHHGFGARRDGGLQGVGIHVHRTEINVGEHGLGAEDGDGFCAGKKAEGGGDDLVASLNACGAHGDDQRVGAGVHADGVLDAQKGCGLLFEGAAFGPHDELAAADHLFELGRELRPDFLDLRLEVEDGNAIMGSVGHRRPPSLLSLCTRGPGSCFSGPQCCGLSSFPGRRRAGSFCPRPAPLGPRGRLPGRRNCRFRPALPAAP